MFYSELLLLYKGRDMADKMNKDLLYKFFEGNASFEEEEEIMNWMEASSENERNFLKERKLYDAMLLLGNESCCEKIGAKASLRLSIGLEFLKIAGVVLLTLCGSYFYYHHQSNFDPLAMQSISVPAGQRINIKLPDGTDVWLNARTTIQYPLSFGRGKRQVQLDGEAYFEVTKDKKKPFIVQTDKCDIEVLGTKFNVEAYSNKDEFETTLMEGSVKVDSKIQSQSLILTPDKKAFLQNGILCVTQVDDYSPYRWKEGLICFKNESFLGIMKDFEKYYGMNILIENKDVLKRSYTGKFRQTDGIDYALRVLQKDIHFSYTYNHEKEMIYIK